MAAITTNNLTKTFGNVTAVNGLNLSVARGELFGLIGSDGAGKTTIIRLLAAVMEPTSGDAWVLERHTVREAEAVKHQIGYMGQRFGLYADLTVQENLHFFADIFGLTRQERDMKTTELLGFSNLLPFRHRRAGNLSGGMKQKLGLACALVHTPQLLLLDEPTNGVDPLSRRDFWRILYQLQQQGVTIYVATAYLDEADRCNRVGLLHDGRLLACDTPQGLRRLMHGAVIEVRTGQPRRTARLLRDQLPQATVGLFGSTVHVTTTDPARDEPAIAAVCTSEGIPLLTMGNCEPSLEDVFVSVMQQQGDKR